MHLRSEVKAGWLARYRREAREDRTVTRGFDAHQDERMGVISLIHYRTVFLSYSERVV